MSENISHIDERLESGAQQQVARLVAGLPEDSPSMLWRSGLNEALRVQSKRVHRRKRILWFATPAMGLGVAGALMIVLFMRPIQNAAYLPASPAVSSASSAPLEASLIDLHRDDMRTMDVVGAGLNPNDPMVEQSRVSSSGDDSEADLEF